MKNLVIYGLVFLGGGLGSACRLALSELLDHPLRNAWFPWGTFAANVLASIALGVSLVVFESKPEGGNFWTPLMVIGFCGGFSTFSTFSMQNLQMLRQGEHLYFMIYTVSSILTCILALWAAYQFTRQFTV